MRRTTDFARIWPVGSHRGAITALALAIGCIPLLAAWPMTLHDLEEMATQTRDAYVGRRSKIVSEGTAALPQLDVWLANEAMDWRLRVCAGVCAERIRYGALIDALGSKCWEEDPLYDRSWRVTATGYPDELPALVALRLQEAGFWYHYIEVLWKRIPPDGTRLAQSTVLYGEVARMAEGLPRYFAARVVEDHITEALAARNLFWTQYYRALEEYVQDGTYPDGLRTLMQVYFRRSDRPVDRFAKLLALSRAADAGWLAGLGTDQRLTTEEDALLHVRLTELKRGPQAADDPSMALRTALPEVPRTQRLDAHGPRMESERPDASRRIQIGGAALLALLLAGALVRIRNRRRRG